MFDFESSSFLLTNFLFYMLQSLCSILNINVDKNYTNWHNKSKIVADFMPMKVFGNSRDKLSFLDSLAAQQKQISDLIEESNNQAKH